MTSATGVDVDVVEWAREAYRRGWSRSVDVSASTRESQAICKEWQKRVRTADSARFACEVTVSEEFRERIDLIDHLSATAYEMKVSGKNPTHEFFKDVFKVLVSLKSKGTVRVVLTRASWAALPYSRSTPLAVGGRGPANSSCTSHGSETARGSHGYLGRVPNMREKADR